MPGMQQQTPEGKADRTALRSEQDDEIGVRDLILALWRQRVRILIYSLAAVVVIGGVAGAAYLLQDKQKVARVEFKLLFEGIDKGQYPNGMKFSASDILSTPVLQKVYDENHLKKFMEFPDFKGSLSVYQTNARLSLLEHEYAQKLAETNLSFESRQRIEAEFLEKKKNLMVPVFSLAFVQENPGSFLPETVLAKVLNDILSTWASYAERVKGANQYQIELVSPNVIDKESIASEDYLIATDRLRLTVTRALKDIDRLSGLPGAKICCIGEKGISLSDLRYRLNDLNQFKLSPLFGLIRQAGVAKFPEFTLAYLQNRLFEIQLKMEEASADSAVYESSLDQYIRKSIGVGLPPGQGSAAAAQGPPARTPFENVPAMIPQFGSSFLDSLVQMAQENSDSMFRQDITKKMIDSGLEKINLEFEAKYYQELFDKINSFDFNRGEPKTDVEERFAEMATERIAKTQDQVFAGLVQSIDEMNAIYQKLSRDNLNPNQVLYTITAPVAVATERPLGLIKLAIYAMLALFVAEGIIVVGLLLKLGLRIKD